MAISAKDYSKAEAKITAYQDILTSAQTLDQQNTEKSLDVVMNTVLMKQTTVIY